MSEEGGREGGRDQCVYREGVAIVVAESYAFPLTCSSSLS